MSVEVYRLHTSVGDGNSGSGDVKMYTDRDAFVRDTCLAMIEAYANQSVRRNEKWNV